MFLRLSQEIRTDRWLWPSPLTAASRYFALLAGLALAAMLAVAVWLTPDEQGFGTHQQLGLPPCSVLKAFHVRCPACGMTTSWAYTVRGQLWRAAAANCGGMLLAILAMLLAPWLLASAVRGCWLGGPPSATVAVTLASCVAGVTLLDWSVRLLAR